LVPSVNEAVWAPDLVWILWTRSVTNTRTNLPQAKLFGFTLQNGLQY
jgi:hypothetical protein